MPGSGVPVGTLDCEYVDEGVADADAEAEEAAAEIAEDAALNSAEAELDASWAATRTVRLDRATSNERYIDISKNSSLPEQIDWLGLVDI